MWRAVSPLERLVILSKVLERQLSVPSSVFRRCYSRTKEKEERELVVMGVESSCDDTGVAVMTQSGKLLGSNLRSQSDIHIYTGGVVPIVASDLHQASLHSVAETALRESGLEEGYKDVDIMAVTVGPGLALCLNVGLGFVKSLAVQFRKPVFPVHHMAAHALMPRHEHSIPFPYLVLLISGGHCILAIAHSPDRFSRLGQTKDSSPGEALDKLARWLVLENHPSAEGKMGGAAIELLAQKGDPTVHPFPTVMISSRCCNFSFSGLKTWGHNLVNRVAMEEQWNGTGAMPGSENIAAAFQEAVCHHLLTRTHRAVLYTQKHYPEVKHFVVSGGVASNKYLRTKLHLLLHHYDIAFHCPPPHLCTDNGVMIAWAAVESMRCGNKPLSVTELDSIDIRHRWPLGDDISSHVEESLIDTKLPKIPNLF